IQDGSASGKYLVSLNKPADGLMFSHQSKANRLALKYASVSVGTISVQIDDQNPEKVNIHSSGAIRGSFLHAIIDISILPDSRVKIYLDSADAAIHIDQVLVGEGDFGLAPDIWNL